MLSNAAALAILSVGAWFILYKKLPRKIRRFINKHDLFSDAIALILTYIILGGTLTALIAAAMVGLMTSALLYIANHPDDFLILSDISKVIHDKLLTLKGMVKEYGKDYRAKRTQNQCILS